MYIAAAYWHRSLAYAYKRSAKVPVPLEPDLRISLMQFCSVLFLMPAYVSACVSAYVSKFVEEVVAGSLTFLHHLRACPERTIELAIHLWCSM